MDANYQALELIKKNYSDKFVSSSEAFSKINTGNTIFIGTGCGKPQFLLKSLLEYVEKNPKSIIDAEIINIWTLGVTPYTDEKFKSNFRHNTFFLGDNNQQMVNTSVADYSPIFFSEIPKLFKKKIMPIDVALIQTSLPDEHGYLSLGISVDIVKAAVEEAKLVIVQINPNMPRVLGNCFINIKDIDYLLFHEEELLEFDSSTNSDAIDKIGEYVSDLIEDGDTIQVGYGDIPNAILNDLYDKRHLGVHTELITDGIINLMKAGVIDNSNKSINKGKSVASFCMGKKSNYEYLNNNPAIEFQPIEYTNNPLIIAKHDRMVAINSCLAIDLTGQATATSFGHSFSSGIGGQADFMRGATFSKHGKTILVTQSVTEDGERSTIVPFLPEGSGTFLIRGDIRYVVTEYGIAYLHGKNIRQQAMELIGIAHPKFRPWLIKEAKKFDLIYKDQAFIPGKRGEYQEELETFRTTKDGFEIFFRSIKISDETLLKKFFYSLSDESMYKRFISTRKDMPHERLQEFCVVDNTKETVILAIMKEENNEIVVGIGQYGIHEGAHSGQVAFIINEAYQNRGIATELLNYLILLAKRQGLLGFTAEVLVNNSPMLHLFEKAGFEIQKRNDINDKYCHELAMTF